MVPDMACARKQGLARGPPLVGCLVVDVMLVVNGYTALGLAHVLAFAACAVIMPDGLPGNLVRGPCETVVARGKGGMLAG